MNKIKNNIMVYTLSALLGFFGQTFAQEDESFKTKTSLNFRTSTLTNTPGNVGNLSSVNGNVRTSLSYKIEDTHIEGRVGGKFSTMPSFANEHGAAEVLLDRLYVKQKLGKGFEITAGLMHNQFSGMFDNELPLNGLFGKYQVKKQIGLEDLTVTSALHLGQYMNDEAKDRFWTIEINGEKDITSNLVLDFHVNYVSWDKTDENFVRTNRATQSGEYESDFSIGSGGLSFLIENGKLPIKGSVELMHNFGAESEGAGYFVSLSAGSLKYPGNVLTKYIRKDVQADAWLASHTADYTSRTNAKAHIFVGGIKVNDQLKLLGLAAFTKRPGFSEHAQYFELKANINF